MTSLKHITLNKSSITTGKLAFITFLSLAFLLPLLWVHSTIHERGNFYKKAQKEIAQGWASEQTVIGPMIVVPFIDQLVPKNTEKVQYQIFLPKTCNSRIQINPQIKKRGIFQVIVYQATMIIDGEFAPIQENSESNKRFFWEKAKVVFNISDMRGILSDTILKIDNQFLAIQPGGNEEIIKKQQGFCANLSNLEQKTFYKKNLKFNLNLDLKGTEQLNFFPIAKDTKIRVTSSAKDPSFGGNFLPNHHHIHAGGFEANWHIPFLARSIPESFDVSQGNSFFQKHNNEYVFGVKLISTVDQYKQAERATKYGILFILYAFFIYFLFEVVHKIRIHIFQYTITACSLLCFFVILAAFSEHLSFTASYCISSILIMTQVYLYATKFIRKRVEKLSLLAGFFVLYAYLFTILRLEDYAFMFGAIGLFVAISLGMYYTRNVSWFEKESE